MVDDLRARSKYGNKKTVVDGITFDSKGEAERYQELKLLERGGVITNLVLQPKFVLQPSFKSRFAGSVRAITYIGDFAYTEDGRTVVEDFKGVQTAVFRLKRALFLYQYSDHELRIVSGSKSSRRSRR